MLVDTNTMFTGKPHVAELGYTFLFRNYDSSLGKWSTADPLGYPDGWNNFAYCNNWATNAIDWQGTYTFGISFTFSFVAIGGPIIFGAIGYNTSSGSIYINDTIGGGVGYNASFSIQGFYSSAEPSNGISAFYDASASIYCVTGAVSFDTKTFNETYSGGITIGSTLIPVTPIGGSTGTGENITTELFNLSDFLYNVFYKVDENNLDFSTIINTSLTNSIGRNFIQE